jgi:hypothetical protein
MPLLFPAAEHQANNAVVRRLTNVGAWCEAQASYESCAEVADDVAIQVGHDQHVKLAGVADQLHARVVHNLLLVLDVGVAV